MTSATPKPRAGEHTPSNTPETDAHERWLREEGSSSDYLPELVTADFARALEAERDLLRERDKVLVAAIEAALDYCSSEAIGTVQQEIADNERMRQTLRGALEYRR